MILPMRYVAVVGAVISMGCGGAELSQTTAPVATATSSAQSDAGVSAAERRKLATCDARRAKPPLVTLPVAVEGTVVAIVVEVSSGQWAHGLLGILLPRTCVGSGLWAGSKTCRCAPSRARAE